MTKRQLNDKYRDLVDYVSSKTDECYMLKTPLSIGNLKILLNSGWLLCNSPYTDQVVMLNTDQITKHFGGNA